LGGGLLKVRRTKIIATGVFSLALLLTMLFAPVPQAEPQKTGTIRGQVAIERAKGVDPAQSRVVVYVIGFEETPPDDVPEIVQKDRRFHPGLLAITAGQKVAFPNADPELHNVFSPSPSRPFDLGQYKQGKSKEKRFPSPGVIDVYCNIHPDMAATILVLPNRRFTFADGEGHFAIDGVPEGTFTLYAYSRLTERPAHSEVTVRAGQATEVELPLKETRTEFSHPNKFGETYRDPKKYR
jgi:plastocyanin